MAALGSPLRTAMTQAMSDIKGELVRRRPAGQQLDQALTHEWSTKQAREAAEKHVHGLEQTSCHPPPSPADGRGGMCRRQQNSGSARRCRAYSATALMFLAYRSYIGDPDFLCLASPLYHVTPATSRRALNPVFFNPVF